MITRRPVATALFLLLALLAAGGAGSGLAASRPNGATVQLDVTTGWGHSCLLEVDGSVQCWGQAVQGQNDIPAGEFSRVVGGGITLVRSP